MDAKSLEQEILDTVAIVAHVAVNRNFEQFKDSSYENIGYCDLASPKTFPLVGSSDNLSSKVNRFILEYATMNDLADKECKSEYHNNIPPATCDPNLYRQLGISNDEHSLCSIRFIRISPQILKSKGKTMHSPHRWAKNYSPNLLEKLLIQLGMKEGPKPIIEEYWVRTGWGKPYYHQDFVDGGKAEPLRIINDYGFQYTFDDRVGGISLVLFLPEQLALDLVHIGVQERGAYQNIIENIFRNRFGWKSKNTMNYVSNEIIFIGEKEVFPNGQKTSIPAGFVNTLQLHNAQKLEPEYYNIMRCPV